MIICLRCKQEEELKGKGVWDMRLVFNKDDSEIIYKESGGLPEQFKAYVFVYSNHDNSYSTIVGFYHPYYDNNKGGVFDGIGAYMEWDQIVAWKCLEGIQVNCVSEDDKWQGVNDSKQGIEWIPVTDRYPDSSRQVLVTYKYDDEYEVEIGEYWNLTPSAMKECPQEFGFGLRHENVIAWAELPEPYVKGR